MAAAAEPGRVMAGETIRGPRERTTNEKSLGHVATTTLNKPGPSLWGMVLTDRRTIFVHLSTDWTGLGAIAGGALGALAAKKLHTESRRPYEFWDASPDDLAAEKKSIVIEHSSVTEWRLKKRSLDDAYRIYFLYSEGGRKKKLYGTITWTAAVPEKPVRSGPERKDTCRRQAEAVQEAFARVLPSSAMARFRGVE